jgi:ATP:ADP antiporter, AAA family
MSFGLFALMKRFGTRQARVAVALGTALFLALVARIAQPGGGTTMTANFMGIPLLFGIVFSAAWLLAADLLEHATGPQRARAYGWIGGASIAGGVVGALVARAIALEVAPQRLFDLAGATLLVAAWIMASAHHYCPRGSIFRAGALVMPRGDHARFVLRTRYTRLLLAIAMLTALAGLLIEFRFYYAAATSGNSMQANTRFFANFYLLLNVAALAVQVLLIPPLQRRVGVVGALFVLPMMLFGGATALLLAGSAFTLSFLRVTEGSLKSSIHRVSWEQAYLPLERAERAVAKLFIDGLGARLAEGTGAVIVSLWLREAVAGGGLARTSPAWIGWLLLGIVVSWLVLTGLLGRQLAAADRMGLLAEDAEVPVRDACVRSSTS